MTSRITINGRIPVGDVPEADFITLLGVLEPEGDRVALLDGELYVSIIAYPSSYLSEAIIALDVFCTKHATAGAVFEYGDRAELFFGPTPEAKQVAHLGYLWRLEATQENLAQVSSISAENYNTPYGPRNQP